jgi:hypothetical protein
MIESYSFGEIRVEGKAYDKDLIIFPDGILENWWREEGHRLSPKDLEEVFQYEPDILVVGTGAYGRMKIPGDTRKAIEERGIELIDGKTGEMKEIYNKLQGKKGKVVAALHLTC